MLNSRIIFMNFIFLGISQSHKLCGNDNGEIFLSIDKFRILSKFKNEAGIYTTLIQSDSLTKKTNDFEFTCQKRYYPNDTKITFSSGIIGKLGEKKVTFNSSHLKMNSRDTNSEPVLVKCEQVCKAVLIVVNTDSNLCNENKSGNWSCVLKNRLDELISKNTSIHGNTVDLTMNLGVNLVTNQTKPKNPSFYECENQSSDRSYLDLESCKTVVHQSMGHPETEPFRAVIEIKAEEKGNLIETFYIIKEYFPPALPESVKTEEPESVKTGDNTLIIMVALFVSTVGGIAAFLYIKWKRNIQTPIEKEFDIFISYSNQDARYVEDILVPNLEKMKAILKKRIFFTSSKTGIGIHD